MIRANIIIQIFKYEQNLIKFLYENQSPFLIKMQKPKDALFRDHLECTLQNVIWIHIRESL